MFNFFSTRTLCPWAVLLLYRNHIHEAHNLEDFDDLFVDMNELHLPALFFQGVLRGQENSDSCGGDVAHFLEIYDNVWASDRCWRNSSSKAGADMLSNSPKGFTVKVVPFRSNTVFDIRFTSSSGSYLFANG